jgi:hypothetical protein
MIRVDPGRGPACATTVASALQGCERFSKNT